MSRRALSVAASAAIHGIVISLLFCSVPLVKEHRAGRVIELDFSMLGGTGRKEPGSRASVVGGAAKEKGGTAEGRKKVAPGVAGLGAGREKVAADRPVRAEVSRVAKPDEVATLHNFEPGGHVASPAAVGIGEGVDGSSFSESTGAEGGTGEGRAGGGHGQGKAVDLEGEGGHGYRYVRDAIVRNVRYPEKARRMGWEGGVRMSFTVLRNGTMEKVRVTGSSGYALLDESAQEAVRRTRLSRRPPQRLDVTMTIKYRWEKAR